MSVIKLSNALLHVAGRGKVEPWELQAIQTLDSDLLTIAQAQSALERATQIWRSPPVTQQQKTLTLTNSGQRIRVSGQPLILFHLARGGDRVRVLSGAPSAQFLAHPAQDWAGSNRPIPEGIYRIGPVEIAPSGTWGEGLGRIWIGLEPINRLNNRSALGIHLDSNIAHAPGSAGCIVTKNESDLMQIVEWVRSGANRLIVDYGFGVIGSNQSSGVYQITPTRKKWLDMIAWCEGTSGANGYRMMFTGRLFSEFADHPRQIQRSGQWASDAAGRYQFLSTTWDEVKRAMSLPDFSPSYQDQAALWLIDKKRNSLNFVDTNNLSPALDRLSWEWASLPASNGQGRYGQPIKTIAQIRTFLNI